MTTIISNYKKIREYILGGINDLTTDQLNKTPEGFNNNIIWNLAHLVVTQQAICYKRAGQDMRIENELFELFKPGTKPEVSYDGALTDNIKTLFIKSIDDLEIDYNNNHFSTYTTWTSRTGIEINNIDEAIGFLLYHEGLHQGMIDALKKLV